MVQKGVSALVDHVTRDREKEGMADATKKFMRLTFGSPAIRSFRFTVGIKDTDTFEKKQKDFEKDGKPYCKKIDRNIGKDARLMIIGCSSYAMYMLNFRLLPWQACWSVCIYGSSLVSTRTIGSLYWNFLIPNQLVNSIKI